LVLRHTRFNDYILNIGFQMFPSSAAARGKRDGEAQQPDVRPSREGIAFANLFRGLHW